MGKALDDKVAKLNGDLLNGDQVISGQKTFARDVTIDSDVFRKAAIVLQSTQNTSPALGFHQANVSGLAVYLDHGKLMAIRNDGSKFEINMTRVN